MFKRSKFQLIFCYHWYDVFNKEIFDPEDNIMKIKKTTKYR